MATALRADGTERHFRTDGSTDALNQDGGRDTLRAVVVNSAITGWIYRKADGELETYNGKGLLTSITEARSAFHSSSSSRTCSRTWVR